MMGLNYSGGTPLLLELIDLKPSPSLGQSQKNNTAACRPQTSSPSRSDRP
jgi:hypothetical protein